MQIAWHIIFVVLPCFSINVIISFIVPLVNLGFARDNIYVMTDETPWDLPTKENIVSHSCQMSLLPSHFLSVEGDVGICS